MSDAHTHFTCRETLDRLSPYLDRELDAAEQAAVRVHLDKCGRCASLFRFEANILTFIGQRLAHTQAPAGLRDRISRLCRSDPTGR
jgi:mycothiol system anti-sigma-R factor